MDNKDQPAMPCQEMGTQIAMDGLYTGLTKLETFAMEFMKAEIIGVYSNTEPGECHNWSSDDFTREAIGHAESLLKALNSLKDTEAA